MRLVSALLMFALATLVAAAPPAAARTPSNFQQGIHRLTNDVRDDHDRETVSKQRCVQRFATKQARRMARQERMFHQALAPVLKKCDLLLVGENVAYGFTSPQGVMDAWMDSEGHAKNILKPRFRLLGVGAKQDDEGRWYLAQVFGTK